ncbi:MAG TPA: hypothetical protein VK887_16700 [Pseudonocardiaceae bacterium]|nr:hypothetical protein [Pseudonocardiaceae bacterium]
MSDEIMVFAPSPLITVTIEDRGGEPDIHVHAGGQGVWQARMISSLGVPVVLCAALGGEIGEVLRHLIAVEGIELDAEPVGARNGGYVHDRRGGQRRSIAEAPGVALDRHELDGLYERTLTRGLDTSVSLLSGPHQGHRQSRVVVITSFLARWSDAQECEDLVEAAAHFFGCLFDVGPAGEAEEADRDVSHGGHDLRGGAGADLGSVFVEGDVADMVLTVFDGPMSAVEGEDVGGVGLAGGEAGDAVHGLVAFAQWVAVQVRHLAGDLPCLVDAGEVQVRDVCGGRD